MSEDQSGTPWRFVGLAFALVAAMLLVRNLAPAPSGGAATDEAMPPLLVEGWLGDPVNEASLKGKVVVVDFWATWCQPCVKALPELARVYEEFRDEPDFQMLGLTVDSYAGHPDEIAALEEFVSKVDGFEWPVAYGPETMLSDLNVVGFPTVFVFDKSGKSVFRSHGTRGLAAAIEKALAAPAPSTAG